MLSASLSPTKMPRITREGEKSSFKFTFTIADYSSREVAVCLGMERSVEGECVVVCEEVTRSAG
jgi:hypothetical protein